MTPTQASITPSILLSTISSVPPSKCFSVRSSIHRFIHTSVHLSHSILSFLYPIHPSIHPSHPTPFHSIPSFLCPSLPSFISVRSSILYFWQYFCGYKKHQQQACQDKVTNLAYPRLQLILYFYLNM